MSYEPTNWKTGDVVTSIKLNHMEQGIADNSAEVYVGTELDGVYHFDLTYNQVVAALQAHKDVKLYYTGYNEGNTDLVSYRMESVVGTSIGLIDSDPYYTIYTSGDGMYFSTDPDDPISSIDPT